MHVNHAQHAPTPRRTTPKRRARRGVFTLGVLLALVVLIGLLALVLNTAYLYLVLGDMQTRADLFARAGAPALLDEDLLRDADGPPAPFQADDVRQARRRVHAYRRINNLVAPELLDLTRDDVRVRAGYVADVTAGSSSDFFDASGALPAPNPPFNTLKVRVERAASGANPVGTLLSGLFETEPVDLGRAAYATLDNRVVGFRPTERLSAPVVPLAIDLDAWRHGREGDDNGNGIREFQVRLESPDTGAKPGNAALVAFEGFVSPGTIADQIIGGVTPEELPAPDFVLGPATPTEPLFVRGQASVSATAAAALARRFERLAGSGDDACRVFPVYSAHGPAGVRLVGFVAARVLAAGVEDDRLIVDVEPCFVIHSTAWTVPPGDPAEPRPNLYVHKLRITR